MIRVLGINLNKYKKMTEADLFLDRLSLKNKMGVYISIVFFNALSIGFRTFSDCSRITIEQSYSPRMLYNGKQLCYIVESQMWRDDLKSYRITGCVRVWRSDLLCAGLSCNRKPVLSDFDN